MAKSFHKNNSTALFNPTQNRCFIKGLSGSETGSLKSSDMVLTVCKNRGMEVLGLIFWSFSRSEDSGTPNSALSTKYKTVSQVSVFG